MSKVEPKNQNCQFKDTHLFKIKTPSNKTPALTKSTNMGIWVLGTSSQLFVRGSKTETKFPKNKVVTGKTTFFVIGPFCTHYSICLFLLAFYMAVLYGNSALSRLLLSTKKRYSSFLKKLFVFQKICFKVKVLKTLKISTDCHIKRCRSLKRRAI